MIWCNLKRFHGTKSENLNNWCDKNLFIAPFVMHIGMVAGVGRRPPAQVLHNSLPGHPPPTGCDTLSCCKFVQ